MTDDISLLEAEIDDLREKLRGKLKDLSEMMKKRDEPPKISIHTWVYCKICGARDIQMDGDDVKHDCWRCRNLKRMVEDRKPLESQYKDPTGPIF